MKPTTLAIRAGALTALILVAIAAASCTKKLRHLVLPNQLPIVKLTAAPIDTTETCEPDPVRSCYSLILNWSGYDPDGRVDHYLYAIDPPSAVDADTSWESTTENEKRLLFTAGNVISPELARDFHVFVIKAVDNVGAEGPSVFRAFFSFTEAPTVQILNPTPSHLLSPTLTPSVRFTWSGADGDGVFNSKPIKYKFTLLTENSEFPLSLATAKPDSLRSYYAPAFAGWDSSSAETTQVQYTNLVPGTEYLFVVVAFDEAGAYSPVFTRNTNMLKFLVGFAGSLGPKITVFNEYFEYSYRGGYCACPQAEVFIEVPANQPVTFNWFAEPPTGADMRYYRWALDIADVSDNTPRTDEENDLQHWSTASLNVTSHRFSGWPGGELHRLYIEAADNVGLVSLAIIRFLVVQSTLDQPLGIIDDTRYTPDRLISSTSTCTYRPLGAWPTAAELDTFLYARGGYPYKCYPDGVMSQPGLFDGYAYDTLGTRFGSELTVRLSVLGRFARLIWILDGAAAGNDGRVATKPMTSLRYMTSPGRFNTLGAYVKQGGRVWMCGGGVGQAANIEWDDPNNNQPTVTFSVDSPRRELAPGRFMYDLTRWQSTFRVTNVPATIRRHTGRLRASQPDPQSPYSAYLDELPMLIERKTSASDPLPTYRRTSEFYPYLVNIEFLLVENRVIEDISNDPDNPDMQSTLDTLYYATANGLPVARENPYNVVMTYYHGPSVPQGFLFSGFNIWDFKRTQLRQLLDFVLQRMWGLQRNAPAGMARPAVEAARSGTRPGWGARNGAAARARAAAASRSRTNRPLPRD